MAVAINVKFVDNPDSADDGKIVVEIDTDYDLATVHTLAIDGPAGNIKTAGSPDATGADATIKVAMPTDIDGNYLPGDYDFTITIDPPPTGSAETYTATYTYTARTASRVMDINAYADGVTLQLVIEDDTAYPDGFAPTRSITVQSPVIAGESNVATATYSANPTTVSLTRSSGNSYENVTYGIVYSATILSEETTDEYTFQEEYLYEEQSTEVLIKVNRDPCDIIGCVETYIREVMDEACVKGGISGLPREKRDTLESILTFQNLYNWYSRIDCYDADKASYYYNQLRELVEDCGCTPTTGARVIPSNGTVYIRGKSAYEIWVEEGNSGTIDDFLNALNPIGDWVTVDDADIDSFFVQNATTPFRYRIEKNGIRFIGVLDADTPGILSATQRVLLSSFDPGVVVPTSARIAVFSSTGVNAGTFYKKANGEWEMEVNVDYSFIEEFRPSGLLPSTPNVVAFTNASWTEFETADFKDTEPYIPSSEGWFWRIKNNELQFKGSFDSDPGELISSGVQVIADDYFTDLGITLEPLSRAVVIENAANSAQAAYYGYLEARSNTLFFCANPTHNPGIISGENQYSVIGSIRLA